MLYIWPYKLGSASAKKLADELNVKRITGDKQLKYKSIIINWGNSDMKERMFPHLIINHPYCVSKATDKIVTLRTLKNNNVSCVEYTEESLEAQYWLDENTIVYGRSKVNSHSGEGIKVFTVDSSFDITLPLYTKGIIKAHEYRVHIAFGKVIDITKKRRRDGVPTGDYIRNINNGWVFCREDITTPYPIIIESLKALEVLGLDFGAVDVLYRERENKAWVLEVNTAPGIESTTLNKYVEAFNEFVTEN